MCLDPADRRRLIVYTSTATARARATFGVLALLAQNIDALVALAQAERIAVDALAAEGLSDLAAEALMQVAHWRRRVAELTRALGDAAKVRADLYCSAYVVTNAVGDVRTPAAQVAGFVGEGAP